MLGRGIAVRSSASRGAGCWQGHEQAFYKSLVEQGLDLLVTGRLASLVSEAEAMGLGI